MRLIDADALKIDYGFTWDDITPTHDEMYALIDRQPTIPQDTDYISRQVAIDAIAETVVRGESLGYGLARDIVYDLPSAQPERLTDDDLETIRIHLSAAKEKLCNQRRWKEAEEYERIINRLKTLEFVQPEQQWIPVTERLPEDGQVVVVQYNDGDYDMLKFPTAYRRCDIVAWMPLPEPYRGGVQNE